MARVRPRRLAAVPGRGVLDGHRHRHVRRAVAHWRDGDAHRAIYRDPLSHEPADRVAARVTHLLHLGAAIEGEGQLGLRHRAVGAEAERLQVERREVDDAIDRLVPLHVPRPVHLECLDRCEDLRRAVVTRLALDHRLHHRLDPSSLRLEAAHPHMYDRIARIARRQGGIRSGPTIALDPSVSQ